MTVEQSRLAEVVPYIAPWSGERTCKPRVVQRRGGIAYERERPGDRDRFGILWTRVTSARGEGRPEFAKVHARRQRRAMLRLLCQVCGEAADRNEEGVLWLVEEDEAERRSWPDPLPTAHPPVCARCAVRAVAACPRLRRHYVALRVRRHAVAGVHGALYRPAEPCPVQVSPVGMMLDDPGIRWVRAGQFVVNLHEFSATRLDVG